MDWRAHITQEPGKRSGQPCVRGHRITVFEVLDMLAGGDTPESIVREFGFLTIDDIRACLAYAADFGRFIDRSTSPAA